MSSLDDYYKTYYKRMGAAAYIGDNHAMTSRFMLFKEWIQKYVPKGGKILDIGCGSATFAAQNPEYEWHGVDFDISKTTGKAVVAVQHNVESVPYPYESGIFDAVVCSEVLEHLLNPITVHVEAKRLLKRDGQYFISTPNHEWIVNALNGHKNLIYDPTLPHTIEHIHTYDYDSHRKCLAYAGFGIEENVGADAHFCGVVNPMIEGIVKHLAAKGITVNPFELHLVAGKAHPAIQHTIALRCKKV